MANTPTFYFNGFPLVQQQRPQQQSFEQPLAQYENMDFKYQFQPSQQQIYNMSISTTTTNQFSQAQSSNNFQQQSILWQNSSDIKESFRKNFLQFSTIPEDLSNPNELQNQNVNQEQQLAGNSFSGMLKKNLLPAAQILDSDILDAELLEDGTIKFDWVNF